MAVRQIQGVPSALPTMAKAALPLLPGMAKKGGDLPDLTLVRSDIAIDRSHVAAYASVCGFELRETLPVTYPHMLAFALHMGIMTDSSFPYAAIGSVHLANRISQHRAIGYDERLTVSATARDRRPHPKGTAFDLVTTVTSAGETVWESTSTYLRPGRGDEDAPSGSAGLDVVEGGGLTWSLPSGLGRRYAGVSGDHNPIHLYPLTAKAFGFPRHIAHGMWTKARSVAAIANRLPDAVDVEVEFKKPVLLPGRVAFGLRIDDAASGAYSFALTRPKDGAPHLVGRTRGR